MKNYGALRKQLINIKTNIKKKHNNKLEISCNLENVGKWFWNFNLN